MASSRPASSRWASSRWASLRLAACLIGLAALAACSSPEQTSSRRETARYLAHASRNYQPPGPPEDPWGPYIQEAAVRFDMPQTWIRSVMRAESGGRLYRSDGELITSNAGAMGLMQVMPGTYDELRARYDLGDDPFHPRDNIMAGVAYMREMYDIYGAPGFLAAYNAGPARLDDYLTNVRGLPNETRNYVAKIAPNLTMEQPTVRSPAEQFAMNTLPTQIPPGLRYGRNAVRLADATPPSGTGRVASRRPVEVAQLPAPVRPTPYRAADNPRPQQYAAAITPPPRPAERGGLRLIAPAMAADASATRRGGGASGQWAIQVGAFSNQQQAQSALSQARGKASSELSVGRTYVGSVRQKNGLLYRARMVGLSRDTAVQACEKIARGRMNCIVLSPDAQS